MYNERVDRSQLLAHIRDTHFAPGDKNRARRDAESIASLLKSEYGAQVIGIGSLFCRHRPFTQHSDIDLVVEGLPPARFYEASARAAAMTEFCLDIIPLESATPYLRNRVQEEGVGL